MHATRHAIDGSPQGFRARWALSSSPAEALALLQVHLRPIRETDAQVLLGLLADLGKRSFQVLERLRGPITRPELQRVFLAVVVLERIGTPAARMLLDMLASGAPAARLTREAQASPNRLYCRAPALP